jgi:rare lipoprotein A (peptidoglycan hydrolase)
MKYSRQLLVVFGIGGAMLALLLPGCALPIGRKETPPPPVVAPQVKEEVPNAQGPKVEQVGNASWYGPAQDGKETASGETFDQKKLTAAHPTLPLGSKAVVTNLETGKSVKVTINDRGPYVKGRKIDLSRAAAQQIGMSKKGVAKVKIETTRRRKPTKKLARPTTKSHATAGETHTDTPVLSPQ